MSQNNKPEKKKFTDLVDVTIFVPGMILLTLVTTILMVFDKQLEPIFQSALDWTIGNFQWLWVSVTLLIVGILIFLMISKYGDIVIGGKDAKPIMKTWTWVSMAITGSIAVGICFYGVAGPLSFFLNPPSFLGIEGGTAEAIIPAFEWTYMDWALAPYAYMAIGGLFIALAFFNVKRPFGGRSTFYVALGKKGEKYLGKGLDIFQIVFLAGLATNYGLASTQLSAGIDFAFGIHIPIWVLIVLYSSAAVIIVCTKGHKLMGTVSRINIFMYITIMIAVLFIGPTNRLLGTIFESTTRYLSNFIADTGFSDVALQTHWLDTDTIFYYSWTLGSIFALGLFFALLGKGRTIRSFVIVNFIVPCILIFCWFSIFGGTAIYQYMNGNTYVAEVLSNSGSGYATWAFLSTLPGGKFWVVFYLIMAVFTFITNADAYTYSNPKLYLKGEAANNDAVAPPKPFAILFGVVSALICIGLYNVGGLSSISIATILCTAPIIILVYISIFGLLKTLFNRKKYDATYIQECIADGTWTEADEAAADPEVLVAAKTGTRSE